MTAAAPIPPITGRVTFSVPVERAFEVFTGSVDAWWPREHHIGRVEVAEVVLEPYEGGRWYERGVDDTECDWGRALVRDPPNRVVFTWQINGMWQFDPDPDHASEIDARFTATGPEQTVVEHGLLERLVGGRDIRQAITGGGGWELLLAGVATVAAQR